MSERFDVTADWYFAAAAREFRDWSGKELPHDAFSGRGWISFPYRWFQKLCRPGFKHLDLSRARLR